MDNMDNDTIDTNTIDTNTIDTNNIDNSEKNDVYNINKYTITEIFKLLDINKPSDLTDENIDNAIVDQIQMLDDSLKQDKKILLFFSDMREKIMSFIQQNRDELETNRMPVNSSATKQNNTSGYDYTGNPIMQKILEQMDNDIQTQEMLERKQNEQLALLSKEPKWELLDKKADVKDINQIIQKTFDRTINIDTRFRDNYYDTNSNDFYISLGEEFKNIVSMEVVTIELPNNRYQLTEGLNSFTILELDTTTDLTYTYPVYLEPGNYGSSRDLATFFAGDFNTEFVETYYDDPSYSFLKSYPFNSNSEKIRIFGKYGETYNTDLTEPRVIFRVNDRTGYTEIYAHNPDNRLIILFNPSPENPYKDIGYLLGFTEKVYNGSYKYISERIFQVNGLSYFYLAIDDFTNNSVRTITNNLKNSSISENIISRFALISQRFGGNFDEKRFSGSSGRKRTYYGPVNINKLRISLIDEFGELLDIKNGDWFITLLFKCNYMKP